jgi:hypothetical protein
MFQKIKSLFVMFVLALAAVALPAAAQTGVSFDVTGAVAAIGAIGVAIALVGAAKTAPAAIATGWRWVVRMIFG